MSARALAFVISFYHFPPNHQLVWQQKPEEFRNDVESSIKLLQDITGQPMLEGLPLARKFKSYVGLKGAPEKLRQYLKDFRFTDVRSAAEMIEWSKVPVVEL